MQLGEREKEALGACLSGGVRVHLYLDDSENSRQAEEFFSELCNEFEALELVRHEGGQEYMPALSLEGSRHHANVVYHGIPSEHELGTLVEWLCTVSSGRVELGEGTLKSLEELDREVEVVLVLTPFCPTCTGVAKNVIKLGIACEKLKVRIIDVAMFPEARERYPSLSVPKLFIGSRTLTGARGADEASVLGLIKEVSEK
ncbi:MAG: hypothetical protein GXN98_00605 [Euryarchaeota archaeon]|nr:hypothetical protein [Euryarchaeota archaeon]